MPPHSSLPPEVETSPLEGGSKDLEGATDGIRSPASEGDTPGDFYLLLDVNIQDAMETTTLLKYDKVK